MPRRADHASGVSRLSKTHAGFAHRSRGDGAHWSAWPIHIAILQTRSARCLSDQPSLAWRQSPAPHALAIDDHSAADVALPGFVAIDVARSLATEFFEHPRLILQLNEVAQLTHLRF